MEGRLIHFTAPAWPAMPNYCLARGLPRRSAWGPQRGTSSPANCTDCTPANATHARSQSPRSLCCIALHCLH